MQSLNISYDFDFIGAIEFGKSQANEKKKVNEMNDEKKNMVAMEKIQEIGALLLSGRNIVDIEWEALAFIVTISDEEGEEGGGRLGGFVYTQDTKFRPISPGQPRLIFPALIELRKIMEKDTGLVWKQALFHLTKPGPRVKAAFEYEDANRWTPKSNDHDDVVRLASSIRPEGTVNLMPSS